MAFLGYVIYLNFIFEGGEYQMFFIAFALPVLLIVKFVQTLLAKSTAS